MSASDEDILARFAATTAAASTGTTVKTLDQLEKERAGRPSRIKKKNRSRSPTRLSVSRSHPKNNKSSDDVLDIMNGSTSSNGTTSTPPGDNSFSGGSGSGGEGVTVETITPVASGNTRRVLSISGGAPPSRTELREARKQPAPAPAPPKPNANLLQQISQNAHKSGVRLLDFERIQMHGRDKELQTVIKEPLERCFQEDARSEVVLILGGSGTGKTALVQEALKRHASNAICCFGKFDQNNEDTNISQPYAAFTELFANLVKKLRNHPDRDSYAERISMAVGLEAFRVTSLIPSLVDLIGDPTKKKQNGEGEPTSSGTMSDNHFLDRSSLKQVFRLTREMMRQICTPQTPIIFVVDDLQWGGKESLALFSDLANDARLCNLVMVGTFRDEEIAPLSMILEDSGGADMKSTVIRLSPFDVDTVNEFLSDLLEMEPASTKKLSNIVYRKTGGNVLFIRQFLDRMQELGYLQFSPKLQRWGWDLPKIQTETNANDDIHQVLTCRIQHLPSTAQTVLCRAACLGNTFHVDVLVKALQWDPMVDMRDHLMNDQRTQVSSIYMAALEEITGEKKLTTDVTIIVRALVQLRFFQEVRGTQHRFAHDQIHFAANCAVPDNVRAGIHWRTGQILRRILDEDEEAGGGQDVLFFSVVDQLNKGSSCIVDKEESIELAALNLKASYLVKQTSAFYPASGYAKQGLVLLANVENKWIFYQSLVTKLILMMAEMAMCTGKSKDCMAATSEIIKHSRTLEEKVPAYFLRMKNLGQSSKFSGAVDEGLAVLKQLGEHIPKESNITMVALQLAKSMLDGFGKTDDAICDLSLMVDQKQKTIMKVMAEVVFNAIQGNEKTQTVLPFLFFRMFQITMRYGLCDESVVALNGYGVLVASILKEYGEGHRFGHLAMQLQSGIGYKCMARASITNYAYLHHLREPLADSLEPLMEGFKAGTITDETGDGLSALSVYCSHYLNAGLPIESLAKHMRGYLALMKELERERVWQVTVPYAQLIDNLIGRNPQPSVLSGEMMNLKHLMDKIKKADNTNALRSVYAARLEAAYWFASYDMAYRMTQHLKDIRLGIGQSLIFNYRRETFFTGMTFLALAKKNKKNNRAYLWGARDCVGKMKAWASRGSHECEDLLLIMQAEMCNVTNRPQAETKQAFQHAVTLSARGGSLQNMALATELAGAYHLELGDIAAAQSFLDQAYASYNEWNAYKKASHLEVLYPQLFSKLLAS